MRWDLIKPEQKINRWEWDQMKMTQNETKTKKKREKKNKWREETRQDQMWLELVLLAIWVRQLVFYHSFIVWKAFNSLNPPPVSSSLGCTPAGLLQEQKTPERADLWPLKVCSVACDITTIGPPWSHHVTCFSAYGCVWCKEAIHWLMNTCVFVINEKL